MNAGDTDKLIAMLAADNRRRALSPDGLWPIVFGLAVLVAFATFEAVLGGVRDNFVASLETPRFLMKFAVTVSVGAAALVVLHALAVPGRSTRFRSLAMILPLLVLSGTVGYELSSVPASGLLPNLIGVNSLDCLLLVPLFGSGPLAVLILALRHAAPTRPTASGVVAGLLAGGIAATFYASYCPDDSPLFVATWYSLGIGVLALLGAAAGQRYLRW